MADKVGTLLSQIPEHSLSIECACGHSDLVPVARFLARPRPDETVHEAVARARCSRCGCRNVQGFRIVYVGGSAVALEGARSR